MNLDSNLFLLRGLPGAGKTLVSQMLCNLTMSMDFVSASADEYMVDIDGNYQFIPFKLPIIGEEKTFKSGFTVRSEKAPNARGIRRSLGDLLEYEDWKSKLSSADTVVVTGNYPESWDTPELSDEQSLILIDTLQNDLTIRANVFLPAATWAEKSGTFENYNNTLQLFERALQPIGDAQAEGQIAMNLQAIVDDCLSTTFNAATIRRRMADAGVAGMLDVELPKITNRVETDMPMSEV